MATTPASKPTVIVHNVASVDGRLAISPGVLRMGDVRWPSYPETGYPDILQRYHPRVLLEGSGSYVHPKAGPVYLPTTKRSEEELRTDFLPAKAVERASAGWLVTVDSRGRIRWVFKESPHPAWAGWHVLVLVSDTTPLDYLGFLRDEDIPYLIVGPDRVDLPQALSSMQEKLGVDTVVATGGGRLGGALLRAGVVDELDLELLPFVVGGENTASLFTAPDLGRNDDPTLLHLLEADQREDGRVFLRYQVLNS